MANIHISYVTLFIDAAVTILIGLLLEIMFLSVDYNRTEHLEFEDDEYHYYVKAVPKLAVSAPEKNVKQITRQQEGKETGSNGQERKNGKNLTKEKPYTKNERAEDILLTRSLNKELGIDDLTKKK